MELKTSESVSCGHPDKICDQISDAILDEFLKQDPESKVACECFITNNLLVIGGEAHSEATVDIIGTAKSVIEEIGYDGTNGFNPETAVFVNTLHEQSSDIRQGVDRNTPEAQGAGDQGTVFGYACNETTQHLPYTVVCAQETMKIYDEARKAGEMKGFRPDAKCQFTFNYDEKEILVLPELETVVFSMQHNPELTQEMVERGAFKILDKLFDKYGLTSPKNVLINPTGKFVIGGPEGDTGLTGRKIIVDTYGGRCPHGGGAFSGKDPSKVDRSAAYYARYIANNIIGAGLMKECFVELSYAIGKPDPVAIRVSNGFVTFPYFDEMVREVFNPTPYNIIKTLSLKRPIYKQTAVYGHFGNPDYPWEKDDKVNDVFEWLKSKFIV